MVAAHEVTSASGWARMFPLSGVLGRVGVLLREPDRFFCLLRRVRLRGRPRMALTAGVRVFAADFDQVSYEKDVFALDAKFI